MDEPEAKVVSDGQTVFNFKTFQKWSKPLVARPEVTIQSRGAFSLNQAAWIALNRPEAVEILFDADNNSVGFIAADPTSPDAYACKGVNKGSSFVISGKAFAVFAGVELGKPVKREVKMVGDVLVMN